jgi:hypothetical protein
MMMTNDFSRRTKRERERERERERKGEVLSGIIWRALLLCISSNNMLSTSENRQEKENGTTKSHARFLFPFSSINRALFV